MRVNCQEVCRKIASDEYAEAGWWEQSIIRFHLWKCPECRMYARQIRELGISVCDLLRDAEPLAPDLERLADTICRSLGSEASEAADKSAAAQSPAQVPPNAPSS